MAAGIGAINPHRGSEGTRLVCGYRPAASAAGIVADVVTRGRVFAALPYVLAVLVVIWCLATVGVPVAHSLRYAAYLALVVTLPGSVVWWTFMVARERSHPRPLLRLEVVVFGTALGYALELPAYVAARAVGFPALYPVLLALPVAACLWWLRRSPHRLSAESLTPGVAWSLMGQIAYLSVWLTAMLFTSHPLKAVRIVDPDEMFHLALVGELRHHFPATYPYVEYPSALTYQWFVHAHMAASTWLTGLTPEEVYRRFDPLVLSTLALLGVAVLAVRVSGRYWAGPIALGLLLLVGSFDVTGSVIGAAAPEERFLQANILMHSPTQTFAFALALPAAAVALDMVSGRKLGALGWALYSGLVVAISGAKVTFLPMFVCGFVATGAIQLLRRRRGLMPPLIGLAITVVAIVASAIVLYDGKSQSLRWEPFHATRAFMKALGLASGGDTGIALISLALLAMWLVPGVGVLALLIDHAHRWDPRVWWLLGASASGYGATLLLGHGGLSEVYFGRSAAVLVAVASAWGLALAFTDSTRRQAFTGVLVAALAGIALFLVRLGTERWREPMAVGGETVDTPVLRLWVNLVVVLVVCVLIYGARLLVRDLSGGRRSLSLRIVLAGLLGLGLARTIAFVANHQPPKEAGAAHHVFGKDGRAAAEWIQAHSSPDEVVMTNVHCDVAVPSSDDECDARHFWMSAVSQRRFVVEGWAYTARSGAWTDQFWGSRALLAANDRIFTHPHSGALRRFSANHAVSWLLVDRRAPVSLDELKTLQTADEVFEQGHYLVLRIGD
jgi:hypothetical protein